LAKEGGYRGMDYKYGLLRLRRAMTGKKKRKGDTGGWIEKGEKG